MRHVEKRRDEKVLTRKLWDQKSCKSKVAMFMFKKLDHGWGALVIRTSSPRKNREANIYA
jgi:hypothetical protein